MNYTQEEKEKFLLFKVTADKLDATISTEVKAAVSNAINQGHKNIIMDMSQVKYCDSSGLNVILIGYRGCKNANGSFILFGTSKMVSKLIHMSQLNTILSIVETESEAIDLLYMEEIERDINN